MNVKRSFVPIFISCISIFFIIILSTASIKQHENYLSGFDLGLAANTLWNITHSGHNGSVMNLYFSGYAGNNYLGLHFSPLLFLMVPIFKIFSSPITLLILQNIILVAGVIPLYLIAKFFKLNNLIVVFLVLYYFLFPAITSAALYDYHPETLFPLIFLLAFYYYLKQRNYLFWFFIGLLILNKENAILFVAFLGLFIFFSNRKERKKGITLFLVGIISFCLIIYCAIPLIGVGHYPHSVFFPIIETHNVFSSLNIFFKSLIFPVQKWTPILFYLFCVFPGIFFTKAGFLLFIPTVFQRILGNNPNYWLIGHYHYDIDFLPISVLVLILGYVSFKGFLNKHWFWQNIISKKKLSFLIIIVPLIIVVQFFLIFSLPNIIYNLNYRSPDRSLFEALTIAIPRSAENVACSSFSRNLPHLFDKKKVYIFPLVADAECIVLLKEDESYFLDIANFLKTSNYYKVIFENQKGYIIKRVQKMDAILKNVLTQLCKRNHIYDNALVLQERNCVY